MSDDNELGGTVTPKHGFNLPSPGGDEDTWGLQLNDNFKKLDNLIVNEWSQIENKPEAFPPIIAGADRVGGVKPGKNLAIKSDGTLDATAPSGGHIDTWPSIIPDFLSPNFSFVGVNQAQTDLKISPSDFIGSVLNNEHYLSYWGNKKGAYQLFPAAPDGVALSIQFMSKKVPISDMWKTRTSGVYFDLPLPISTVRGVTPYQLSVNVVMNDGSSPPRFYYDMSGYDQVKIWVDDNSDKIATVSVSIICYVDAPKEKAPIIPPPIIERIVPMDGGARIFWKPQVGTILEAVQQWTFVTPDQVDLGYYTSNFGPSYRFAQVGVDEDEDPSIPDPNVAWRKKFRASGLTSGRFENGKKYIFRGRGTNVDDEDGPSGPDVIVYPSEKAISHQPKNVSYKHENGRYVVLFDLPPGVGASDVKSIQYYVMFYDDAKPLPYLNERGAGVTGEAIIGTYQGRYCAYIPVPECPPDWKKYFWISLENEYGSSPDCMYQFDPPLIPIVLGPKIDMVSASIRGISMVWHQQNPQEQVFWTTVEIADEEGEVVAGQYFYGKGGEWDYTFDPPLARGTYRITVTQYGYDFTNSASDVVTAEFYDDGEQPPPIPVFLFPAYRGLKVWFKLSAASNLEKIDGFGYVAYNKDGGREQSGIYDSPARGFDVLGIDDDGMPFYSPRAHFNKLLSAKSDGDLTMENGEEYEIELLTYSTDRKTTATKRFSFTPSAKAPINRARVKAWKYDATTKTLNVTAEIHTLAGDDLLMVIPSVFVIMGSLDDGSIIGEEQWMDVPFKETFDGVVTFTMPVKYYDPTDPNCHIAFFINYATLNGASPMSWIYSDLQDEAGPEPSDPRSPTIKSISATPTAITVEWTDDNTQDEAYYGYGYVIKDQYGSLVSVGNINTSDRPFVYAPGGVLPPGKYTVWIDALGFYINATANATVVVPDSGQPQPPTIVYATCVQPHQLAVKWASDEPRITNFILELKGETWDEPARIELGPDVREWQSETPGPNSGLAAGKYTITVQVVRDTLISARSAPATVNVLPWNVTAPKITAVATTPGSLIAKLYWDNSTVSYFDVFDIVVTGPGGTQTFKTTNASSFTFGLNAVGYYRVTMRAEYMHEFSPYSNWFDFQLT